MTQSREGNGCANGKRSRSHGNARLRDFLYLRACGFHSVIRADVGGEGAVLTTLWPRAPTSHNSKGCLLHHGALESRPPGRSPHTTGSQQPCRKSTLNQKIIRGPEKSALVRFLVCTFHAICCCAYLGIHLLLHFGLQMVMPRGGLPSRAYLGPHITLLWFLLPFLSSPRT